ncbi:MAG: hypothetical protein K0R51_1099 [Cytophagaceae bacterium]|jgi:hypothetical protein|nr:hypothetical protein [Cytophagaceae bacterium]
MSSINCLIGDIVSGFVRTEFLLSQIFSEMGLTKGKLDFFADGRTERKLDKIRLKLVESNLMNKEDYISLVDTYNELRKHRNSVVHSLVLTNASDQNDFLFHNYQLVNGEILNKTLQYKMSDLENIKVDLRNLHNKFYVLHFDKVKDVR